MTRPTCRTALLLPRTGHFGSPVLLWAPTQLVWVCRESDVPTCSCPRQSSAGQAACVGSPSSHAAPRSPGLPAQPPHICCTNADGRAAQALPQGAEYRKTEVALGRSGKWFQRQSGFLVAVYCRECQFHSVGLGACLLYRSFGRLKPQTYCLAEFLIL